MHRLLSLSIVLVIVVASGCDGSNGTPDAGLDARVLEMSELFGECVEDSQCPGEGAVCRGDAEGFPRGYCTIPCDDRTPCDAFGVYHHCTQRTGEDRNYCELRCLNGIDCGRDGYSCAGELPPSGGICIGLCSADADCSPGNECDVYSGRCYPPGAAPTDGAITGEPCGFAEDCRSSFCLERADAQGYPTGFVDGMCTSYCILPTGWNSNTLYDGPVMPTAGCQGTQVCFPGVGSYSEGDLGVCYPGCTTNEECRPGYQCQTQFGLASGDRAQFENGICQPIDCSRATCPTGYRCQTLRYTNGAVRNLCSAS